MKKGFSVVKAIIVLFFIAALGAGGYYGYNNYLAPMLNPNIKFIPENLQAYARGEDADLFLIFDDSDSGFYNFLEDLDAPDEVKIPIKAGIFMINNSEECGFGAVEFESKDEASEFKTLIEGVPNPSVSDIEIEQEENIVTIAIEDSDKCLPGKLINSPLFKKINSPYEENKFIVGINNEEFYLLAEMMMGSFSSGIQAALYSNIPTANAQMISPGDTPAMIAAPERDEETMKRMEMLEKIMKTVYTTEHTFVYSQFTDSEMNFIIKAKIMDESKLKDSNLSKQLDIDEIYEDIDELINEDLNDEIKKIEDEDYEVTASYEDLTITMELKFDLEKFIEAQLENQRTAQSRGRDAARMGNLNSVVASLETFKSDNGYYPKESACLNEVDFMNKTRYFYDGKSPQDPLGEQEFGDITCEDGYYYQALEGGYILWANMEVQENGNTNLTPYKTEVFYLNGMMPEKKEEGIYYILDHLDPITTSEDETEPETEEVSI